MLSRAAGNRITAIRNKIEKNKLKDEIKPGCVLIGIDPGTNCGIAVIEIQAISATECTIDLVLLGTLKLDFNSNIMSGLMITISRIIESRNPITIIEDFTARKPVFTTNIKTAKLIGRIFGTIETLYKQFQVPRNRILTLNANVWKPISKIRDKKIIVTDTQSLFKHTVHSRDAINMLKVLLSCHLT